MTQSEHSDAPLSSPYRRSRLARAVEVMTGFIAILGGLLMLASALLVTVSVLGRWLYSSPIDGDFEFVKMGTAMAVFAYLPYTQARHGNIFVDTFTGGLPGSAQRGLDAVWNLAYLATAAAIAYALTLGTLESLEAGETTMQRQIALWPSIAVCAGLTVVLTLTTAATLVAMLTERKQGAG